jgi:hypothetical protein
VLGLKKGLVISVCGKKEKVGRDVHLFLCATPQVPGATVRCDSIRYCLAKKYLKKNLDICGKCITFAVSNQKC